LQLGEVRVVSALQSGSHHRSRNIVALVAPSTSEPSCDSRPHLRTKNIISLVAVITTKELREPRSGSTAPNIIDRTVVTVKTCNLLETLNGRDTKRIARLGVRRRLVVRVVVLLVSRLSSAAPNTIDRARVAIALLKEGLVSLVGRLGERTLDTVNHKLLTA